jgi:hypothetical protein
MATAKSNTASTTKTKPKATPSTATSRSDASQVREGVTKARHGAVGIVRQGAERALDVPVGAVLIARDRVTEVVEPWTSTETREKELKSLRTQVTRELNKFERRGGQARRRTTQRVRTSRNRVERELKARRREVEKAVRENRTRVEKAVKQNRGRAEDALSKAQERVSELV